ncbi:hypothetical protein DLJ98_03065 [Haemophilus influenzae]|nr:hypothetical protein DLJ98_03065 [Haemophilus influenzae]
MNTYVTDYLNEQAKDLKLDAEQKEKLKQAAQQMTALAIGAAAGAVTGGTSETIKQGLWHLTMQRRITDSFIKMRKSVLSCLQMAMKKKNVV